MPFYKRNPSYQLVSCGEEIKVQDETAFYLEDQQNESLINPRLQPAGGQTEGIREYLLRKISIFIDINFPVWNNLHFTKLSSCPAEIKHKPCYGIEAISQQKGGRVGGVDRNGFNNHVPSSSTAPHSFIDGRKTKNRLKIIVSRKKLGLTTEQKTSSFSNIFSWKLNHRSSSNTFGYSTLVLAVFLLFSAIFDTHNGSVKGKQCLHIIIIVRL